MRDLPPEFTNLHVHSKFSILDGMGSPEALVARAKELGQTALAITDHGGLYAAVEFQKDAKKAGIKPILGAEVYVAPRKRTDRESKAGDDRNNHLVLLAENQRGWENLVTLVTESHLTGFYRKPRVDHDLLVRHSEGLIALSGCMSGEVPWHLRQGDEREARRTAAWYRDVFGPERYYVEVQNQHLADQAQLNRYLVALAADIDVPLVATNDSHYVTADDHDAHEALLCVQLSTTLDNPNRALRFDTREFYLRSAQEMAAAFPGLPEALRNTMAVAERCALDLSFARTELPAFPIPDGLTEIEYLARQVKEGLVRRYGGLTAAIWERAEYELGVIERTGYPRYFLIVADAVRTMRARGIIAMPRGSVSGSICIYALGICDLDPLKYGLMFERFLHEERVGMPDIDMDVPDDRRAEVLEYLKQRYGPANVAQICTFGVMHGRSALRDVGRAAGIPHWLIDQAARLIPPPTPTEKITIPEAIETIPDLRKLVGEHPELQPVVELATRLEGTPRSISTHAAGVVVAARPLATLLPLQHASRSDLTVVTQWPFTTVEEAGFLKMDWLGVRNLSIVREACALIRQRHGVDLYGTSGEKLALLPESYERDESARRTFDMLAAGETTAVFQVESPPMRRILRGLRPTEIRHLLAVVALYRPGPMENIPAFIEAKNGEREIEYPHPDLEPILQETYGVVTYQDQVLLAVRKLGGYTWGQADILRKAMGKKIKKLMDEQEALFRERMAAQGHDEDLIDRLWHIIAPFAGYGFPKGHAAAYAALTYITAYLKANYPVEYMAAVLSAEAANGAEEKVAEAVVECRRLGVRILPPDINRSAAGFTVEDVATGPAIRYGLSGIKQVGAAAQEAVVEARTRGPFKDLVDFCLRANLRAVNKGVADHLVKAGALACFGEPAALLASLPDAMGAGQVQAKATARGQLAMFDFNDYVDRTGADVLPASRRTLVEWEKEALGLYLTEHPLARVADQVTGVATVTAASLTPDLLPVPDPMGRGRPEPVLVCAAGFVVDKRILPTKKGETMAILTLEDFTGQYPVVVFPRVYEQVRTKLAEDNVVLVRGSVGERMGEMQIVAAAVELLEGTDVDVPDMTEVEVPF